MSAGRPVPRNSYEYRWVASVIRSVEKLSGLPSRWNGELFEETERFVAGRILHDGSLTVSADEVLKPVALAYTAGRPLDKAELSALREAVLSTVHEAKHLTHALGDQSAPGAVPVYSRDAQALEEGLTEHWAEENLDAVIKDLELDKVQPGLLEAETEKGYPTYTAATDEVVRGTAEGSGLAEGQVRRALEHADRTQRWAVAADLVIDGRLATVMPPQHRDHVRTQLIQAMRVQFREIPVARPDELPSEQSVTAARQGAELAMAALSATTTGIENHYRDWYRRQAAVGPEVDHLRKLLDTQAPDAGAGRGGQDDGAMPATVRQMQGREARDQSRG
ncbi:hypothetical protein [Kribbella sp. DT2]|uniref:hypothetical protein n=1 Tax=Kribbella sp. DT2 TaxID=3393427 RepID=UPI003CE6AAE8